MLLGRTGSSAISGKKGFSIPFPPIYQSNLGVIMLFGGFLLRSDYDKVEQFAPMHQRPNYPAFFSIARFCHFYYWINSAGKYVREAVKTRMKLSTY